MQKTVQLRIKTESFSPWFCFYWLPTAMMKQKALWTVVTHDPSRKIFQGWMTRSTLLLITMDTYTSSMKTCSTSTVTPQGRSFASRGPTPSSTANELVCNCQQRLSRYTQNTFCKQDKRRCSLSSGDIQGRVYPLKLNRFLSS